MYNAQHKTKIHKHKQKDIGISCTTKVIKCVTHKISEKKFLTLGNTLFYRINENMYSFCVDFEKVKHMIFQEQKDTKIHDMYFNKNIKIHAIYTRYSVNIA